MSLSGLPTALMNSEKDIKRRKRLASAAFDKLKPALEDKSQITTTI